MFAFSLPDKEERGTKRCCVQRSSEAPRLSCVHHQARELCDTSSPTLSIASTPDAVFFCFGRLVFVSPEKKDLSDNGF